MKSFLGILFAVLGITLSAAEILWQADFNKKGELDWKKIRVNANDSFVTENGVLVATCSALGKNVNKGAVYETALPDVERGALYFEVRPNAANSNSHSYNHLSLMIRFNGRLISLRPDWWLYHFAGKNRRLASIPDGKWLNFKIEFDRKAKTIAYFYNDMQTPVFMEKDVVFNGPIKFQFGNYGLTSGTIINHIRNVRLEKFEAAAKKTRQGAVVLRGVDFDAYDINGILKEFGIKSEPVFCDVAFKTGVIIKNDFYLTKSPLFAASKPELIIMADFPFNGTLTEDDIKELVSEVNNGAKLIVLGGMFTLNRGEFKNSTFNKILPVQIKTPWDIAFDRDNFAIQGINGAIAMYYKCPAIKGAKVSLKVENSPLLTSVKRGSGAVAVYSGIPGGRQGQKGEMLHKQKSFPQLLKKSLTF
ncbi:MAG: hypothetical protein IKB71_10650 [Lentisphaeria bacterium]|nr:hypothetical protein [Lentisphaeria bacterium]